MQQHRLHARLGRVILAGLVGKPDSRRHRGELDELISDKARGFLEFQLGAGDSGDYARGSRLERYGTRSSSRVMLRTRRVTRPAHAR
jgi:hypothetical protein